MTLNEQVIDAVHESGKAPKEICKEAGVSLSWWYSCVLGGGSLSASRLTKFLGVIGYAILIARRD